MIIEYEENFYDDEQKCWIPKDDKNKEYLNIINGIEINNKIIYSNVKKFDNMNQIEKDKILYDGKI